MKVVTVLMSFTETLKLFQNEELKVSDLSAAIFCFGCGRSYAFHPSLTLLRNDLNRIPGMSIGNATIVALQIHIQRAEEAGRATWYRDLDRRQEAIDDFKRKLSEAGLNVPNFGLTDFFEPGLLKRNDEFVSLVLIRHNNRPPTKCGVRIIRSK